MIFMALGNITDTHKIIDGNLRTSVFRLLTSDF